MLVGPPHSGLGVAVADGAGFTEWPELTEWVEVITGLEIEPGSSGVGTISEMGEIDSTEGGVEGGRVATYRLGPSGLFQMNRIAIAAAAPTRTMINKTRKNIFRLRKTHAPCFILHQINLT